MRKAVLLQVLALTLAMAPRTAAQVPNGGSEGGVQRFRLDNGLTVLMERRARLPLVNVTCLYRVGAANEVPGITGIAHYIEHMVFRGTENVSPADITGTFDRIGGRWNAYTELDQTLYAETLPAWALESALRIEAERMSRAQFDPEEFNRERSSVIAEINSYISDPAGRLSDLVRTTSFEIHPYRSNTLGYDVPAATRDEAFRFYKDYYGPNNAVLVIVGDVDEAAARALIQKYFGGLARAPRSPEVRVVEPLQLGEKRVTLIWPGAQQHVELAFRAPAATHADFATMLVLDALLSGATHTLPLGDGEALASSRIAKAVEAAGGSGAGSKLQVSRYANLYVLRAKAPPGVNLAKIEAALESELDRISRDGATAVELEAAQRRLSTERALAPDSLREAGHHMAFYEALGSRALDGDIEQAAMRVTSADLQAFVRGWLKPELRTVGVHRIGPAAQESASATSAPRPAPAPFSKPSPVPPQALRPLEPAKLASARKQLANGVVLRAAQREGAAATVKIRIGIGSRLEGARSHGLALLSARLLTSGAVFRADFDRLGAWLSATDEDTPAAFTAGEFFDIQVRCPEDSFAEVMSLLGRRLAAHTFSSDEVSRAQSELVSDAEAAGDDAAWVVREAAIGSALPAWRPAFGTANEINSLTADDVNGFIRKHLRGSIVRVGIATPLFPEKAIEIAAKELARIRPGTAENFVVPSPEASSTGNAGASEVRKPLPGRTRVEIVAAAAGPVPGGPDELPLRLMNYIVGETGYAGRLGRALTGPGLAYSVDSTQDKTKGGTSLEITTATAPADLDATLTAIRRELKALATNGVEDWEVQEAQAYSLGRLVFNLDENLAGVLVDSEYFGKDLLDLSARSAEILAVTHEELNRVARRYYDPRHFHFGLAGALTTPK